MMRVRDIELSGADYFLFAMDRVVRSAGDSDSPCRMILHLDGKLEPAELQDKLTRSPVLKWMTGAQRSTTIPFTLPRWQSNGKTNAIAISDEYGNWQCFGKNCSLLEYTRNNGNAPPSPSLSFAFEESGKSTSSCILNWHHALMDAHGAEYLLKHLAPDQGCDNPERLLKAHGQVQDSRVGPKDGFFKRLAYARKSIHYITKASAHPIATLTPAANPAELSDQYCLLRFSQKETRRIHKRCESLGLSYYHSLLFLGATLRALHFIRRKRGEKLVPYLVPVPLNLRKKGGYGPAFSNNVSFLFFRIDIDELRSLAATLGVLKKQMREQVSEGIPYSYLEMMNILRRLPLPMYAKLLSGPTRGQMASFFFSYTGDCCPEMDSFMGLPVQEIVHLAPATSIPGLSVVFMQHSNSLKAVLSLRDSLLSKDELVEFEKQLHQDLLVGSI